MNGRILELAKNPELFQIKDLELLNGEINKHPYIQSLRALHLLGTHRLKPENYANELSVTAAYTTDKKILYQLINSVEKSKPSSAIVEETKPEIETAPEVVAENEVLSEEPKNKFTEIESKEIEAPKPVFVNGELNRILFEGEEDFLEREIEIIDLESTIESGQIVTQKSEVAVNPAEKPVFVEAKDAETFSKETIVEEEIISEEKDLIENSSNVSLHETEEFLPEVKVEAPIADSATDDLPKFSETDDAETFSKEIIVEEEIISEEKDLIENPSNVSFYETEAFLPKVESSIEDAATNNLPKFSETDDAETFSKEIIVKEEIISEEKDLIENPSNVSFHETEAFLPEVNVETPTENPETEDVHNFTETTDAENFSKEVIIEEESISEEETTIEDSSKLSFHATAEFLPDVKISSNPKKEEFKEVEKPALNKHEAEMQRLIAEVEAKMKASKSQKKSSAEKDETPKSAEVNFSETQSFDLEKAADKKPAVIEKEEEDLEEEIITEEQPSTEEKIELQSTSIVEESIEKEVEADQEKKSEWKPMSFASNIPDALISKTTEETSVKKEEVETPKPSIIKQAEKETLKEETPAAERPIFNVSFFTQNVSAQEKENKKEEIQPLVEEKKPTEILEDSNVPNFINTWQSWLKIDRTKEVAKEKIEISITEIKNKVIENFIEKEPRISKLKEESDFVIKERNDDISHLMTETLANLYTEQKLYAKAIKAFGILSEKHPDKKPHFDDKIKQIKELRQNK
ncbi:hypothetical protein [Kaistella sp.]|uniref:hypothetical protein n=1 Tax=Kaistella sp. TaxID=2782235 RepID=UPI00359FF736